MKLTRWLLIAIALTLFIPAVLAQDEVASTEPIPSNALIEGGKWVHQGTNRCSAAALTIHLSFYTDVTIDTYFQLANSDLNSYGADASVRIEEMAREAEEMGLGAIVRRGGTLELLKQLVAAGFPVLVENVYYDGGDLYRDWMSHNRVLVGYDDALQELYFRDPLLGYPDGDLVARSYERHDQLWHPFNRDYLVIYRPEEEDTVKAILGEHWDATRSAEIVLETAQAEIDANIDNVRYSYFNRGWAQLQLEMYEEATESFDVALNYGLPMRMLWYEFGPFEAFLAVERYEDVRFLVGNQINVAGNEISIEEWYYYAARAYEGLGNIERAILNYEVAVFRNANYTEAAQRLQELRG